MHVKGLSRKIATLTTVAVLMSTASNAETITLKSLDGSVSMTGELMGFDGNAYTLKTMLGEITVPVDQVSCDDAACPDLASVDFRMAGDGVLINTLVPELFKSFANIAGLGIDTQESDDPAVNSYAFVKSDGDTFADVDIQSSDATGAFQELLDGNAEIVMTRRPVAPDESKAMTDAGLGNPASSANQIVAALDGIAIVTSVNNPVGSLTVDEISRIFAGRITNWSVVGGPNLAVKLVGQPKNSNATTEFSSIISDESGLDFAAGMDVLDGDADVIGAVNSDDAAIGFVRISGLGRANAVPVRQTCGILSEPNNFTVKSGEYPLSRNVYFYHSSIRTSGQSEDREQKINGFLNFAQSSAAQPAVTGAGFVDQTITSLPVESQGRRLINSIIDSQRDATFRRVQRVIRELAEADRLSATFRFKPGIAQLDARSTGDVKRLVEYLWTTDLTGKELVLAGFSDAAGTGSQNESLSLKRANQVLAELKDALGTDANNIPITTMGFGEVAPVGCNDTPSGRAINRRVEVWIRDAQ